MDFRFQKNINTLFCAHRIKVDAAINSSTDIEGLADQIIETQKLLTAAKFRRVVELLLELQQHKAGRQRGNRKKKHKKKHRSSRSSKHKTKQPQTKATADPPPSEAKVQSNSPQSKYVHFFFLHTESNRKHRNDIIPQIPSFIHTC